MATPRNTPYSPFNFLVSWDGLDETKPQAGFQEVSGLGIEITVAEYRAGNFRDNAPIKVTGIYKVPDITMKRGVIGALDFYEWLDEVRNGSQTELKTVTIQLMSEDRATVAMTWEVRNARPIKYTAPAFNGKATDVAIEEFTVACESVVVL